MRELLDRVVEFVSAVVRRDSRFIYSFIYICALEGDELVLRASMNSRPSERSSGKPERTSGNQTQAAHLLHITRDTLRYKTKKFGLR